jgi:hypothetical protein
MKPSLARFDQSTLPIICPGVLISMREENKADLAFGIFPTRTNSPEPRHKPRSDFRVVTALLGIDAAAMQAPHGTTQFLQNVTKWVK